MYLKKYKFILSISVITIFTFATQCFALDLTEYIDSHYLEPEKTISMDFKNANLNDVLKIFSQQSGLNFIAATTISSLQVNLYLDNVPVEEALERILSANNLIYELTPGSNIFVVKQRLESPIQLITRVYQLRYATVPTSKLKSTLSPSEDEAEEDDESGETEATFGSGIIAAIDAVNSPQGTIVEDTRTNSIVVTDVPSYFPVIEQTIARLDIRIPQILIEVEMLDISKSTGEEIGAKWGNSPFTFNGGQKDGVFPFSLDNLVDDNIVDAAKTAGARDALFADPRYRVSTASFAGLTLLLQFLRTKTDTRNLARPRILTLNNETAEIRIETDEVISVSQTTTSSDGQTTSSVEAERSETGVFLKVTPQANTETREITLAIEPRVIQARASSGFAGSENFKDPEERITRSILRVRDGDTIIIAGLLRADETDIRTNVPFLEKIPLLGMGFRHKDKEDSERELIVFITPHIVEEDSEKIMPKKNIQQLTREQDVPSRRQTKIKRELSLIEDQR